MAGGPGGGRWWSLGTVRGPACPNPNAAVSQPERVPWPILTGVDAVDKVPNVVRGTDI